jgi:hypothetical protein
MVYSLDTRTSLPVYRAVRAVGADDIDILALVGGDIVCGFINLHHRLFALSFIWSGIFPHEFPFVYVHSTSPCLGLCTLLCRGQVWTLIFYILDVNL